MENVKNTDVIIVATKYIKGGKEVVKYDTSNGRCWVEVIKGDLITIKKTFEIIK